MLCLSQVISLPGALYPIVRDLPTEVGFTSEDGVDNTEVESTTEVGNSTDELVSPAETDEVTAETGIEVASIKIDVHCSRIRYTRYTRHTRYNPIGDIRYTRFTV